jgi:hypothetical protein
MKKSGKAGQILLKVILMLSVFALTSCAAKTPVVMQSSMAIRILPGDCKTSPEFKGWGLSDDALARLLELAEACQDI